MSVERKEGPARTQRVKERLEILEEELKENKKVLAIAGVATSVAGLIIAFKYYSRKKARDEETRVSLEKIAQKVEEDYASNIRKFGEGTILLAAPEVAQDLELLKETEGGRGFFKWFRKICGLSGAQPGMKGELEGQIIHASIQAGERIVKPELEKEIRVENPPTKQSEPQGS